MALRGQDEVRVIARIAQRVEHHHRIRHGRENRSEAVLAIEPLGHKRDRACSIARRRVLLREQRLDQTQERVDGGKGGEARRAIDAGRWPSGARAGAAREELVDASRRADCAPAA